MTCFPYIFIILMHLPALSLAQSDTLYFFDFEDIKDDFDPITRVRLIRNNSGRFTDAKPFLPGGGLVHYGTSTDGYVIEHDNYEVGNQFLYHSASWYRHKIKYEGRVFSHVELELPDSLAAGKIYKLSYLTCNMPAHRYKPSHYGVKFSEKRIFKNRSGSLLSEPDIFYDFKSDAKLVPVKAIFYAVDDIHFIYFGCFKEDSLLVPRSFTPLKSKDGSISYSDTARHVHITKPTRVIIDNLLIQGVEKEEVTFGDIYFDVDKDEIQNREDFKLIVEIAEYLLNHPHTYLLIQGFTDETGTLAYNMDLSARRAEAIKKIILDKNISEDRIVTLGKGIYNQEVLERDRKYSRKVSFGVFK